MIRINLSKTSNYQLSSFEKKLDANKFARAMTIDTDMLQISNPK